MDVKPGQMLSRPTIVLTSARVGSVLSWSFWIRPRVKCTTATVPGCSVARRRVPSRCNKYTCCKRFPCNHHELSPSQEFYPSEPLIALLLHPRSCASLQAYSVGTKGFSLVRHMCLGVRVHSNSTFLIVDCDLSAISIRVL
eukprot:jgi/Botrbrau1/10867/Bobra.0025s0044.1